MIMIQTKVEEEEQKRDNYTAMGYNNNHYNYQVAVIFGILIGALLLLGLVFFAIYMITKGMRDDDKDTKKNKYSSGGRGSSQWAAPSQAPAYRPSSAQMYQPPPQNVNQSYEFSPPVAASPAFTANPQYSMPPLVTSMENEQYNREGSRMQHVQPDAIYTQGPAGYVRSTPVEYTQTPYHQSSV